MFLSGDNARESHQRKYKNNGANLAFFINFDQSLLTTHNTIMYITIQLHTQNHQVTLDGRSCFLQGKLEENPSKNKPTEASRVGEVSIAYIYFCDSCQKYNMIMYITIELICEKNQSKNTRPMRCEDYEGIPLHGDQVRSILREIVFLYIKRNN